MTDATAAPAEKPAPVIAHTRPRTGVVELNWPITVDGKALKSITLRRLTTRQVADFVASIAGEPEDAAIHFPIYCDDAGNVLPPEVIGALDDDDAVQLNTKAMDFLPQRWKQATASESSLPAPGENTGQS